MKKIRNEVINVDRTLKEYVAREKYRNNAIMGYNGQDLKISDGLQSLFHDPFFINTNQWGTVHTIPPYYKGVSYRTLRRVSEKAWILNLCISNIIKKVRPFQFHFIPL